MCLGVVFIIGQRMKFEREKKGLSQKYISEHTGIPSSNISRYETGERNPDIATLIALADFLGCSVDYLLGRSDNPAILSPSQDEELEDVLYRKQNHLLFRGNPIAAQDMEDLIQLFKFVMKRRNSQP